MSPWDFEPIDEQNLPPTKGQSVPLTSVEIRSLMYNPSELEWPAHGRDAECDRIIAGIEAIMGLAVAEPFLAPVDLNAFPNYAIIVEYPIDLTLIRARLENRFYRRVTAVQYDVRYVEQNAAKFNRPGTEIVQMAKLVAELCLRLISDSQCTDVMPLYNQLTKDTEFARGTTAGGDSDDTATSSEKSGPSQRRSSGRRLSTRRPASRRLSSQGAAGGSDGGGASWRDECWSLLDLMYNHADGVPFREPVDANFYPDYYDTIDHPMDLGTIKRHLEDNSYENPVDFCKDVSLVFSNSKAYNTDKHSMIYLMTLRLRSLFEERSKDITRVWRMEQLQKRQRKQKTNKIHSKVLKLKLNAERSLGNSPSKSQASTSSGMTSRAGQDSGAKRRVTEELVLGNSPGSFKFG